MMPSDITGTDILQDDPETGRRRFTFIAGPIFTNMILADEINRTPPKTQAALLEAMQERHVTAGGSTYPLPDPFFVLATQNPIEQEGTYPLPEAQLDRFMLNVLVVYPTADEELEILRRTTGDDVPSPSIVLTGEQIVALQHLVRRVPVADHVFHLRPRSRPRQPAEGAGGHGTGQEVRLVGRRAARRPVADPRRQGPSRLNGRLHAGIADVRHVARPVLRHRIVTTFHAEAEGISPDQVIDHLLEDVPAATEKATARLFWAS